MILDNAFDWALLIIPAEIKYDLHASSLFGGSCASAYHPFGQASLGKAQSSRRLDFLPPISVGSCDFASLRAG